MVLICLRPYQKTAPLGKSGARHKAFCLFAENLFFEARHQLGLFFGGLVIEMTKMQEPVHDQNIDLALPGMAELFCLPEGDRAAQNQVPEHPLTLKNLGGGKTQHIGGCGFFPEFAVQTRHGHRAAHRDVDLVGIGLALHETGPDLGLIHGFFEQSFHRPDSVLLDLLQRDGF